MSANYNNLIFELSQEIHELSFWSSALLGCLFAVVVCFSAYLFFVGKRKITQTWYDAKNAGWTKHDSWCVVTLLSTISVCFHLCVSMSYFYGALCIYTAPRIYLPVYLKTLIT